MNWKQSINTCRKTKLICEREGFSKEQLFQLEGAKIIDAINQTYRELSPSYICSFCMPSSNRQLENGLLSMWRGYGNAGGYCLVLESKGLMELMNEELDRYSHSVVQIGDIAYTDTPELQQKLERFGPTIRTYVPEMWCQTFGIDRDEEYDMQAFFRAVNLVFPMIKDDGFKEELEARLVCSPLKVPEGVHDDRDVRKERFFDRSGTITPYIDLFANLDKPFPLNTIVVGPSPQAERRAESAKKYLSSFGYHNVDVRVSGIPFMDI